MRFSVFFTAIERHHYSDELSVLVRTKIHANALRRFFTVIERHHYSDELKCSGQN